MDTVSTPAVSVVIPAYRVTAYIAETLDSIRAQTFTDFEVILVNDGCPDTPALEQVLEPYLSSINYIKQSNGGPSAAKNAGIRAARAPLVATVDGDDIWRPDYLAVQLAKLRADPSIDVLYTDAIYFGKDGSDQGRFMDLCPSRGPVTFEALLLQTCNVFTSVTARKEALLKAGLFNPDFRRSEDFDLWVRVVKSGGRIAYHREPLVRYRRRRDSLSADIPLLTSATLKVLDNFERVLSLTAQERATLEAARRHYRVILDFHLGKAAFLRGDQAEAIQYLRQANANAWSPRLTLILAMLRISPGLLRRLYRNPISAD
jgi:glycosyltransferase involved in cell wall biosynthesis